MCAICHFLARDGQEVLEAVTVAAGYAACEPHIGLAEAVGGVDPLYGGTHGLSLLKNEARANCGQCGRFLGSDLGALPAGPDDKPLCIDCVSG